MIESRDDVYVDEPWLLMRWDAENQCVHSVWKGFANSAEFRAALMKGLQAVRDRHATGYAMVTASSGLGKITVEEIVKMVDNKPLLMRTFNSVTPALKWVREA